ncbi:TPA: restriction endonuclease subunit S [Pseudomonas aeruginosa]|jgi:type I restriction enzyme S subunit|uniref:EcoKI restriction-modification system protein HsdS n=6 Tax=Pseudomonas aeruginosa group TaxID=136841 RepID=A0A2U2XIN7_PSEAI|nr:MULTISPECIES: restriction endonuclease subunit S [Pseudomonas]EQL43274.1 type I restriction-modification protein subunit S [Pseudomonas aeruginosa VRFPA03]KEA10733.1 type I restriction-modification protein subunit S [Pseudomonas aeruginosa C2773C]CDI94251.1 type I restriction-modification system subunit S [Pseudomonas aeruginosa PA38182]SCZ11386.1 EcoKI restriction-modification system protein HsdS [Acinetobacter baumannii]ABR83380.1 type I restriction-modification system, S subunit [Pseudom
MTALLTDNLPLLAGAPNGTKKLRELILELAVRGKLVPQDPNDEPASELLKRIAEEKARLVSEGKVRKQKPLAEIGAEEKPFDVPTNWEWVRVAAVGHDWGQKTPDKAFTYIDVGAVDNAAGRISAPQVLMAEDAPSRARKVVRPGTVIYSTIRPYLLNVAVIEEAYEQEPIASTAFAIIHPYLEMPARYFLCYLRSPVFVRYVESVQMGIAYPAINDGQFFSGLIPLPPLAEQHRIVAKVDELMALCDRLEARQADADSAHAQLVQALLGSLTQASDAADFAQSWQRLAEHFHTLFTTESSIDALKQTLLQLAVMGKLVPQDPNDEPASELLKRIADAKEQAASQGRVRKVKTATDYRASDTEVTVPAGWSLSTVGEVTICRDGERIPVSQAEREGRAKTYDYYGASGVIDKIDGYLFDKPLLLVGEDGANLINRSTPIAFMARGKYWVNNHAHVLDGVSEALLLYVQLYFNAIDLKPYVTGTAQPKMNQAKMNSIVLLLPPEAEQHRIVAKVDQLMALCDQLKARLNQARQVHEHLASALVEQAVA